MSLSLNNDEFVLSAFAGGLALVEPLGKVEPPGPASAELQSNIRGPRLGTGHPIQRSREEMFFVTEIKRLQDDNRYLIWENALLEQGLNESLGVENGGQGEVMEDRSRESVQKRIVQMSANEADLRERNVALTEERRLLMCALSYSADNGNGRDFDGRAVSRMVSLVREKMNINRKEKEGENDDLKERLRDSNRKYKGLMNKVQALEVHLRRMQTEHEQELEHSLDARASDFHEVDKKHEIEDLQHRLRLANEKNDHMKRVHRVATEECVEFTRKKANEVADIACRKNDEMMDLVAHIQRVTTDHIGKVSAFETTTQQDVSSPRQKIPKSFETWPMVVDKDCSESRIGNNWLETKSRKARRAAVRVQRNLPTFPNSELAIRQDNITVARACDAPVENFLPWGGETAFDDHNDNSEDMREIISLPSPRNSPGVSRRTSAVTENSRTSQSSVQTTCSDGEDGKYQINLLNRENAKNLGDSLVNASLLTNGNIGDEFDRAKCAPFSSFEEGSDEGGCAPKNEIGPLFETLTNAHQKQLTLRKLDRSAFDFSSVISTEDNVSPALTFDFKRNADTDSAESNNESSKPWLLTTFQAPYADGSGNDGQSAAFSDQDGWTGFPFSDSRGSSVGQRDELLDKTCPANTDKETRNDAFQFVEKEQIFNSAMFLGALEKRKLETYRKSIELIPHTRTGKGARSA